MNKETFNLYGRIISAVMIGIFLSLAIISGILYMVTAQVGTHYYDEGYAACMQGKEFRELYSFNYIN